MTERTRAIPLKPALFAMLRHPLALLRDWNWKAAGISALLRGYLFLQVNWHADHAHAAKAMAVEMVYATAVSGLAGAMTQRLRYTTPRAATAATVFLGIPAVMLVAQAAVHHATGTPRLGWSLLASFVFASLATGFNWFAMQRGAFVTGSSRGFLQDLVLVPRLLLQMMLTLAPRRTMKRQRPA